MHVRDVNLVVIHEFVEDDAPVTLAGLVSGIAGNLLFSQLLVRAGEEPATHIGSHDGLQLLPLWVQVPVYAAACRVRQYWIQWLLVVLVFLAPYIHHGIRNGFTGGSLRPILA